MGPGGLNLALNLGKISLDKILDCLFLTKPLLHVIIIPITATCPGLILKHTVKNEHLHPTKQL